MSGKTKWTASLLGGEITVHMQPGRQPNWFQRVAWTLLFGAEWERAK